LKPKKDKYEGALVYTDGACSGNPGPGGWAAIIAFSSKVVIEAGGHEEATTNNRMEMRAAVESLRLLEEEPCSITLFTDSIYLINGCTKWLYSWKKKGWKTAAGEAVANQDLWEELDELIQERKEKDLGPIFWSYVKGHDGNPGNERADEIAVSFSKVENPELFHGHRSDYKIPLEEFPKEEELKSAKQQTRSVKKKNYVSLVNGIAQRHDTWASCEQRVKGQSRAKFKKVGSEKEEQELLESWGLSLKDLK
jgi:ribonuclease HI